MHISFGNGGGVQVEWEDSHFLSERKEGGVLIEEEEEVAVSFDWREVEDGALAKGW